MPACIRARVFLLTVSILAVVAIPSSTVFAAAPINPSPLRSGLAAAAFGGGAAQDQVAITGVVRDASGGVVAGATVAIHVSGRRFSTATTDTEGRFRVDAPARVPIELRVDHPGFAPQVMAIAGRTDPFVRDVVLPVAGVSDTLVVTAARAPESRLAVTEAVSTFTRRDLEALGSHSLADVIRFVPGVSLESTGREGQLASMFSRGGESDYNLVLIDGVRVNQSGGIFDFSRITAAEIDRVEVVRGAQSALWGSDAMGSVVQVFTRRAAAAAPQFSAALETGSFAALSGDARVDGGVRRAIDFHLGASHRRTDGAFRDLLPEADAFTQRGIDAGIGARLGPRATLRASARYTKAEGRSVGPIVYGARDTGTRYDTRDFSGSIAITHAIASRLTGAATYNDFRYKSDSGDAIADPPFGVYAVLAGTPNALFPNGTRLVRLIAAAEFNALVAAGARPAPGQFLASRQVSDFPFSSGLAFDRPAFRYQADYTAGAWRTTAGYEWERESNPLVGTFRLDNHAVFVQQQIAAGDRWFAAIGGRIDRKDSYDTFASPKLSAGGFIIPYRAGALSSLKIFGNVGAGIKSPTFGERFGGAFADPSPDLKVERARTGDIGVESTFASQRFLARVIYFDNDYVDQIAFRSGVAGDGIPEYINIDGSTADGWEIEGAVQRPVGGVVASASYAYVDHRVVTNLSTSQQFQPGQPLLRRPRHSGTIRVSFVRGRLAVNADARIVGDRHDHSFLFLRTVPNAERPAAVTTDITVNPGYLVIGGGVQYDPARWATVFARVSNAADREYESVLGYPALPRALALGVRLRLAK